MFLGPRADIPRLLLAMDAFLFPSLFEGLGLALVEAQAAGLPCLISDSIPLEADVVTGLIQRLPLNAGVQAWAHALTALIANRRISRENSLALVENSDFNVERSLEKLYELYSV